MGGRAGVDGKSETRVDQGNADSLASKVMAVIRLRAFSCRPLGLNLSHIDRLFVMLEGPTARR